MLSLHLSKTLSSSGNTWKGKRFFWQADIVWGTATPGHIADYTAFGVWKPAGGSSPEEFGIHDPNQTLTTIGGGCKEEVGFVIVQQTHQLAHSTDEIVNNILSIADYINEQPAGPNDFYTLNMLINFRDMPAIPHFADSIAAIIDGIQGYVDEGKIVWATLGEKYDLWYAMHPNPEDYFNSYCDELILDAHEPHSPENASLNFELFPNPTTGKFTIRRNSQDSRNATIYNMLGIKIMDISFQNETEVDLSKFPEGLYLVRVGGGSKWISVGR